MQLDDAEIIFHEPLKGGYRLIKFKAPEMAAASKPGQYVQVRIPNLEATALRRPFSICGAEDGVLTILYKQVGRGTFAMGDLKVGQKVNILGPLGDGVFPLCDSATTPLLIGGGFGVAPLLFLAKQLPQKGVLFVGGRTSEDILITEEFEKIGWEVQLCTNDGSVGTKGFVTAALDAWLEAHPEKKAEMYACGPEPMLKAIDERAARFGRVAWLSLDHRMACGVGACLGCIQKVRVTDAAGNVEEKTLRVCKDGPIFKSGTIVWEA